MHHGRGQGRAGEVREEREEREKGERRQGGLTGTMGLLVSPGCDGGGGSRGGALGCAARWCEVERVMMRC